MEASGICRLCQRERKLCKSHILPEFLYEPLYDKRFHRYHVLSADPKERNYTRPTGLYEKLLCEECDRSIIGPWETYAALLLNGGTEFEWTRGPHGPIVHKIDYSKFKLFQMSLLWRCHISTRPEFSEVYLGPKHGERLRQMIRAANPGQAKDYGCILIAAPQLTDCIEELILPPVRRRIGGQTCYWMLAGQLFWLFCVSSPRAEPVQSDLFLNMSGTVPIIIERKHIEMFLKAFANDLRAQGKLKS